MGKDLPGESPPFEYVKNLGYPKDSVEAAIGDTHLAAELPLEIPRRLFKTDRLWVEYAAKTLGNNLQGVDEIIDVRIPQRLPINSV